MTISDVISNLDMVCYIVLVVGGLLVFLGGTVWEEKVGYIGMVLILVGLVTLFTYEPVLTDTFDKVTVSVREQERDAYGVSDIVITVPLEDKDVILSKEHSINDLREMYNSDYDGVKYLDEDEAFIVTVDPTVGYEITTTSEDE